MSDPTLRFSNRVENYVRYRPHYPGQILEHLRTDCGWTPASIIADIGSGTGFLAEQFLVNGNRVFGIEPNREMRQAGERLLQNFSNFTSLDATAEETTLLSASVDLITAGQAFHWFDRKRCREEFKRILRPNGWVVLIWNDRRTDSTPFLVEYEHLLQTFGTDYAAVDHKRIDAQVLRDFFGEPPVRKALPNYQHFDLPSLTGRLLSSSYVPDAKEPRHAQMLDALAKLFEQHQKDGRVTLEYDTLVYYGRIH
jgi:SAM-dependent methyltransferase